MRRPRGDKGPNATSQRDKDDNTLKVQRDGTETDRTKAESPLDKNVPRISTKKIKPLVVSYLEKLHNSDISNQDARAILVELFLEIIQTTSDEILAALKNCVLSENEAKSPQVISVEAVKNALHCSLCTSFKAALGSALQSMEDLLKLLSGEVTNRVNSALSRSKVQDSRLVVEEESSYKTPRKNFTAMVCQAKVILCLVRDKMCPKCGPCDGPAHLEDTCPLLEQKYTETKRAPKSRFQKVKEKVHTKSRTCCGTAFSGEASPHREHGSPKASPQPLVEERASVCLSPMSTKVDTSKAASLIPSLTEVLESVQDILEQQVLKMDIFRKDNECSQLLSLISNDAEDTASTIVSIIVTEMSLIHSDDRQIPDTSDPPQDTSTKKPCSKVACQKIKSFFVLCYAKVAFYSLMCKLCCKQRTGSAVSSTFYSLMCRLCCKRSTGSAVSTEELMETASSLLKKLLPEPTDSQEAELCIYERLSQDITSGQHKQLTQQLSDLIIQNLPQKGQSTVRSKVQGEIDSFMNNIQIWLQTQQQQQLVYNDMVQSSLKKIQRVVHKSLIPKAPVSPHDDTAAITPHSESVAQTQRLFSIQEVKEVHVPTEARQDVPEATARSVYVWERSHYRDLVYEVVSLVLRGQQGPDMKVLDIDLLQQLESKMAHIQEDIQVKPTMHHFENVAKSVYRDLCSNYLEKEWVARLAVRRTDHRAEIVDCIIKHLLSPQKKSRFSSFLQRLTELTAQLRDSKSF